MVIEKKLNKLPLIYSMVRYLIKKTFFTYFKVEIGYLKGKMKIYIKHVKNLYWKIFEIKEKNGFYIFLLYANFFTSVFFFVLKF